uniref:Polycomb group ring finger 6 n=1 Tax=Erpetoichthys calabaricus TaxID=27687 RepID=A0A8C4T5V4_ERPCA
GTKTYSHQGEVPYWWGDRPCTVKPGKQRRGLHAQSVFRIPPELDVSLLLEFVGLGHFKEKRFVRVSGDATIRHVELFIRRKMGIGPACQVDVICGDHLLESYRSLRDIQKTLGEISYWIAAAAVLRDLHFAQRTSVISPVSIYLISFRFYLFISIALIFDSVFGITS